MPRSLSNSFSISINLLTEGAHGPLLFYDGHCALCNGAVNFILKRDKKTRFRFAPIQGTTIESLYKEHPELQEIDSLILISGQKIYIRSDAAIEIATIIGGGWKLMRAFRIIPAFIRNWLYDGIARVRYRWFGRYDTCPMPPSEWRDRFLP